MQTKKTCLNMCHFDTIVIFHGCDMVLILTMYHNNYLQHWIIFSFPCIIDDMNISQMHILKKSKYTETHCFVLQGFSVSFTNIFYFHLNTSAWFLNVVVRNEIQSIQWHNEKYYKGLNATDEIENQTTVGWKHLAWKIGQLEILLLVLLELSTAAGHSGFQTCNLGTL